MKFIIQGGKKLHGSIAVNGSKNSALKLLSAALLARGKITLQNVPDVADVRNMIALIRSLGIEASCQNHTCKITPSQPTTSDLDVTIAKSLRASIMLAVPLLVRTGKAVFPHPGGCVIGERPIDVFIDGYQAFGATVVHEQRTYTIVVSDLRAARFVFPIISVQGTESLMMLATQVKGTSQLINAACEPDIVSLANFLNSCGAKISGAGTPTVIVEGGHPFHESDIEFSIMPDRIEAGSFLCMALATQADIRITNLQPHDLDVPLAYLKKMGAQFEVGTNTIHVLPSPGLTATNVKTHEYPGFPTDIQSPMVVLMTQAQGQSIVHETIFEGRLAWVDDLKRMGAQILNLDNFRIAITGPTTLRARTVESLDIRAGMAYLIAGLLAPGTTTVCGTEKIDRGYERIEERLSAIGADITRIA